MLLTKYHAKYFAHELTKRNASDSLEKLGTTLQDAKVDLNPHQIEAALFAFRSPLSNGAILADEVGLGKTIEAGILLSQTWAVGKRKLLIIVPSNLRKQWANELAEKFYLPTLILESKNFKKAQEDGKYNPFDQKKIVICSYHFAKNKADYLKMIGWDLVAIDEAHKLRNVYKPYNKIARTIKDAIYPAKKILMTATPLQNSLMELYGLISVIDDHIFGDKDSFRSQFTRLDGEYDFQDLKDRIAPVTIRTLRRQVQEYVRYTSRIPMTLQFEPTPEEQELYESVSSYLQRNTLWALPSSQRHLLTLVMRKLLASSSYAISGTLNSLIKRLEKLVDENKRPENIEEELAEDYENIDELIDEWDEEEAFKEYELNLSQLELVKQELEELKRYYELAISIEHNAKGEQLMSALDQGFKKLEELGAAQKTIIFTESRRTQDYLYKKLQETKYADKIVLFNGSNNDQKAKTIYSEWQKKYEGTDKITGSRTADKRQALVDYFREEAQIMIATEAAAEGVNLQFCSMVINYDLPWNPQRVEQRIGRCHRYGQKYDVVVVNFINSQNAADQRVFQLLNEKFHLFDGVFGASDEVLGTVESGVDFEKKIVDIYQKCRTTEEINQSFDNLQRELEQQIQSKMKSAKEKLMENFDAEVIEKLKVRLEESKHYLNQIEERLWWITKYFLKDHAVFSDEKLQFELKNNPFSSKIPLGNYTMAKEDNHSIRYRINHPLAKGITKRIRNKNTPFSKLTFNLSNHPVKINSLEEYKGKKGIMRLTLVEVHSLDVTEHLIFSAISKEGYRLDNELCQRMFNVEGYTEDSSISEASLESLDDLEEQNISKLTLDLKQKDDEYFNFEVQKLNRWADDRIYMAEKELRDTKKRIRELNSKAKEEKDSSEQLEIQKKLQKLNSKQRKQRQEIFDIEDKIEEQRDQMIDEIEKRIQRDIKKKEIFTISWEII